MFRHGLWLATSLVVFVGCKVKVDPEEGQYACNDSSDCIEGFTCDPTGGSPDAFGVCRLRCGGDSDCTDGQVCGDNGVCRGLCSQHGDCPSNESCIDNVCQNPCPSPDCQPEGLACVVTRAGSGYECVPCSTSGSTCGGGKVCVRLDDGGAVTCTPGCDDDNDCYNPGSGGFHLCTDVLLADSGGTRRVCTRCDSAACGGGGQCTPRQMGPHSLEAASYCDVGGEGSCSGDTENDSDGAIDCHDIECSGTTACGGSGTNEANCNDNVDDDDDGETDCSDIDCAGANNCSGGGEAPCDNHNDDDGDSLVDCFDGDCLDTFYCRSWHAPFGNAVVSQVVAANPDGARTPSLAFDSSGRPWVAFIVAGGSPSTPVAKVRSPTSQGGFITEDLAATDGSGTVGAVRLTTSGGGHIGAVWDETDAGGTREVFFKYYDGSSWRPLVGSDDGAGVSNGGPVGGRADVAYYADGTTPQIVWQGSPTSTVSLFAKHLADDGTNVQWLGVDGTNVPTEIVPAGLADSLTRPELAITPTDLSHVAWTATYDDGTSTTPVIYMRSMSASATTFGSTRTGSDSGLGVTELSTGSQAFDPSLTVSGEAPVLAWRHANAGGQDIKVGRLDGGTWKRADGSNGFDTLSSSTDEVQAGEPEVVMDPSGSYRPIVVYSNHDDVASRRQILLARHDGTSWRGITGSAGGPGISAIPGSSPAVVDQPTVAVDDLGAGYRRVCVAWRQGDGNPTSTPPSEIHLRCAVLAP